jgi:hypothetical protein
MDHQEIIDRMIGVVPVDSGRFRNVTPKVNQAHVPSMAAILDHTQADGPSSES